MVVTGVGPGCSVAVLGVRCLARVIGGCEADPRLAPRLVILRVLGRPLDDILQAYIQRSNPAY